MQLQIIALPQMTAANTLNQHCIMNNDFIMCIRKYCNSLGLMYRIISVYNDSIFLVITNVSGYIYSRVAPLILYKYYINNNEKHS